MSRRTGIDWNGSLGGNCPVQGEGTVNNHPWYFRARGEYWTIDIAADHDKDPVDVGDFGVPGWHDEGYYGEWPSAGWMSENEAWLLIEKAMADFHGDRLQYVTDTSPFVVQTRSTGQTNELAKYHRGAYRGTLKKHKALRRIMRHMQSKHRHAPTRRV